MERCKDGNPAHRLLFSGSPGALLRESGLSMGSSNKATVAAALSLAVFTALLGLELGRTEGVLGDGLARSSYDTLHGLRSATALDASPVVIVYLDLSAYFGEHQDPGQPWPRELHARLVKRVTAAGARAIV